MDRRISVERLFSLGDYRNIKFVNVLGAVNAIPENVSSNPKAMGLLWYLLLLEIEEARNKYDLLTRQIVNVDREEIAKLLEDEKEKTYYQFITQLEEEVEKGE